MKVIIGGESHGFATPFDAVVWLMVNHLTAEQIQAIRLNTGRKILNSLPVERHEWSTSDNPEHCKCPADNARGATPSPT